MTNHSNWPTKAKQDAQRIADSLNQASREREGRTIEQRIKDIDVQLAIFDRQRELIAQWGGFTPIGEQEQELLRNRENLFTELHRSKTS